MEGARSIIFLFEKVEKVGGRETRRFSAELTPDDSAREGEMRGPTR